MKKQTNTIFLPFLKLEKALENPNNTLSSLSLNFRFSSARRTQHGKFSSWSCVLMAELVGPRLYSCCNCRNHVALHDDVISKAFQGRNGRAFLFSHAMNVMVGAKEDRQLMTGLHTVADVYCSDCREVLGWKYERAYEETQKYKEGKFILEKSKIVKENW
ncbi:hypothetical protein G4B88_006513 [Cannabis sativa]|uniref:Protein yippee-like n=3 Tax=Cannabis sativa TaxID=3483 RepID=A0A7J6H2M4_CANSA|nr:hypothetical protein G4B88_006513 [Cannabis sativa]